MKNILLLAVLIVAFSSCSDEYLKYEFVSSPIVEKAGSFTIIGLDVSKSISKADILDQLDIASNAEIVSIKVTHAYAAALLNGTTTTAQQISYSLSCDALPFPFNSHEGTQDLDLSF